MAAMSASVPNAVSASAKFEKKALNMPASYTGKGDRRETCLLGRTGVGKDDARIEALGCYDELNSAIGVAAAFSESEDTAKALKSLQDDMHTICAELGSASEGVPIVTDSHLKIVEMMITECESFVGQPKHFHFVLPGETKTAALLHMARAVSRRAERNLVRLSKTTEVSQNLLSYANRISSLLYIMARVENKRHSVQEKQPDYKFWKGKRHVEKTGQCCNGLENCKSC